MLKMIIRWVSPFSLSLFLLFLLLFLLFLSLPTFHRKKVERKKQRRRDREKKNMVAAVTYSDSVREEDAHLIIHSSFSSFVTFEIGRGNWERKRRRMCLWEGGRENEKEGGREKEIEERRVFNLQSWFNLFMFMHINSFFLLFFSLSHSICRYFFFSLRERGWWSSSFCSLFRLSLFPFQPLEYIMRDAVVVKEKRNTSREKEARKREREGGSCFKSVITTQTKSVITIFANMILLLFLHLSPSLSLSIIHFFKSQLVIVLVLTNWYFFTCSQNEREPFLTFLKKIIFVSLFLFPSLSLSLSFSLTIPPVTKWASHFTHSWKW